MRFLLRQPPFAVWLLPPCILTPPSAITDAALCRAMQELCRGVRQGDGQALQAEEQAMRAGMGLERPNVRKRGGKNGNGSLCI